MKYTIIMIAIIAIICICYVVTYFHNDYNINTKINELQYEVNELWDSVYCLDEEYTTIITHINNNNEVV